MTTATQRDYYEVLGVSRDATQEAIRKAYLKLAHKYHPDKTGGDKAAEEKLKEINEAYDTLKNAERRAQYDQAASNPFGSGPAFQGGAQGPSGFSFSGDTDFGSPFEDILGAFFRGGARPDTVARPGNDLEVRVSVSLDDVSTGATRGLRIPRRDTCGECQGKGSAPGHEPQPCGECKGTGQTQHAQGTFRIAATCARCKGTGRIVTHPCRRCGGTGRVATERELSVKIPAGVADGTRLRLPGQGDPGERGAPAGDLYVYVTVEPHDAFTRDGDDIVCEVPVTLTQAALGAKVRVPTLKGMAELNVPEGTQTGTMLRMRGLGLPRMGTKRRGDQLVHIAVEIPKRLSRRQRELLDELGKAGSPDNYPRVHRFLERFKNRKRP